MFFLQILLGDGMLIYRCFVVYGRSWRVIAFPSLLWLGTATCGLALPIVEATFNGNAALTAKKLNVWTDAGTVLTLCANLFTTCRFICIVSDSLLLTLWLYLGLIVVRLYLVSRRGAHIAAHTACVSNRQPVRYAMRIVIESGVFYTLSTIVLAAVSYSRSFSIYPVSDSVSPSLTGPLPLRFSTDSIHDA
jgi:hypothetical protein